MTDTNPFDAIVNGEQASTDNPFDAVVGGGATTPAANPFEDAIAQGVERRTRQQFLEVMRNNKDTDPERQAKAIEVSKLRGVPVGVAYQYLEDLTPQERVDYDSMVHKAPATAKLLADPVKGPVAFPDAKPLGDIEEQLKAFSVKKGLDKPPVPAPIIDQVLGTGASLLTPEQQAAEQAKRIAEAKAAADALPAEQAALEAERRRVAEEFRKSGGQDLRTPFGGNPIVASPEAAAQRNWDETKVANAAVMRAEVNPPTQKASAAYVNTVLRTLANFPTVTAQGASALLDSLASMAPAGVFKLDKNGRTPLTKDLATYPNYFEQLFPTDKGRAEDVSQKAVAGIASGLPFIAGGVAMKAAGLAPGWFAALAGGLQQAGQGEMDAVAHGASVTTKNLTTWLNFALGATEALPIEFLFATAGSARRGLDGFLASTASNAAVEAIQNSLLQQTPADLWAKYAYDPKRDVMGNSAEAFFIGGLVGGVFGATSGFVTSKSQSNYEKLLALAEQAKKLKLANIAPKILDEHIAELKKNGQAPEHVTAPANAVETLFQELSPDMAAQFPKTAQSLAEAKAMQAGDPNASTVEVTIPTEELIRLKTLKGYNNFAADVSVGGELSLNEHRKILSDVADYITNNENNQAREESPVFKDVRDQLLKAGQSQEVATAGARYVEAFFQAMGARNISGKTAVDLARRYGISITNSSLDAEQLGPQLDALRAEGSDQSAGPKMELTATARSGVTSTVRSYEISNPLGGDKPETVKVITRSNGDAVIQREGKDDPLIDISNMLKAGFSPEKAVAVSLGDHLDGTEPDVSKVRQVPVEGQTAPAGKQDPALAGLRDRLSAVGIKPSDLANMSNEQVAQVLAAQTLNQSDPKAAIHNLSMVAQRGERAMASTAEISKEEDDRIAAASKQTKIPVETIRDQVIKHKLAHPGEQGWAPLVFNKIREDEASDGTVKYKYEYVEVPYSFNTLDGTGSLEPGTPEYQARVDAVGAAMAEEVRAILRRALAGDKNALNILAQAGWYKAMRSRLRQEFGGLGDLFADLLGATSPNTPVRENWKNAVDSLRRASRGDFDELIGKWVDWADNVNQLENDLRAWVNQKIEEFQAGAPERKSRMEEAVARRDQARQAYKDEQRQLGRKVPEIVKDDAYKAIGVAEIDALKMEASAFTKKALVEGDEYQAKLAELRAARDAIENLLPTKENNAKYGFNGRNVANAMIALWRVVKNEEAIVARGGTKPKAINFSGNLIGFRNRATIDVWAARMLQRLAGFLRIPSMAEGGVSGNMREDGTTTLQFGFGQDAFGNATQRIRNDAEMKQDPTLAGINDDDLQALVWFIEKELWTVNNWTSVAGEGGSFELEANLTGPADQARVVELRRIIDSNAEINQANKVLADVAGPAKAQAVLDDPNASEADKKKAAKKLASLDAAKVKARQTLEDVAKKKADARHELAAMERTVDRFVGGLSIQMSQDTQGVDFVPTDADMAVLNNKMRTAIYESDNGATVLASKTLSTEGRYGGVERSVDLEVIAREGYDPTPLWLRMLTEAQAAKQDSTFLSRVLRDGEEYDPLRHRPGVEIYFQDAAARGQLEQVLADLAKEGVEFLTVIVDGRRMPGFTEGEMPPAVGVRLQYVPEFEQRYGMDDLSSLDDAALAQKIEDKAIEMQNLAQRVAANVPGVSFAGQFWYDTQVAFASGYQEKINGLAAGVSEEEPGANADRRGFTGQPIRQGIEDADRHARETSSGEPGGQQPGDLLGRDAQGLDQSTTQSNEPPSGGSSASGTTLNQNGPGDVRGSIQFGRTRDKFLITLTKSANLSTFIHEVGHLFLEVLQDLVERGEASAQQVADLKTLKRWMGIDENARIDRNGHEKFARGIEQHTMEGKAPSLALHGIFQKFKAWMIFVYKRLANVRGDLNDEVRAVMDRLVASDAAIAEARAMVGWRGQPMSQEETGLTDAEYKAYVGEWTKANDAQSQDADARIMLEAARELKKTWAEEKTKVTKELEAELASTRGFKAWKLLETGEGLEEFGRTQIKIDPTTVPKEWRADTRGMTADADQGGMDLDMVAELLGFDTGEQLLQSIGGARLAQRAIPARVRQVMVERHGEMDAASLSQEAMKAVHNTPTMDVLFTEFRALAAKANLKVGKDTKRLVAAAAAERVAKMTARQLEPGKWRRAEVKAAEEAGKMAAKGKDTEAALAKRKQLVAAAMVKASLDAQDRIEKMKDYLTTFTTNRRRAALGKAGQTYLDAVDQILEGVQLKDVTLKAIKARKSLDEIVKEAEANGEPVFVSDATKALLNRKNYTEMTLEELEGVHDAVKNLWTIAKEVTTVRKGAEKIALENALSEIEKEAEDLLPVKKQRDHLNPSKIDKMMAGIGRYHAGNLKIEFIVDWLGKTAHSLIYQPISNAAFESWKLHRDLTAPFMDKLRKMPKEQRARWNTKRQFLNYPIPMKGANIWAVALNLGNASNKEKLLAGYGWTEAEVMAELNTFMTKEDWDLVQETWDTIEKMWPKMSDVVRRATGLTPPKIEATEIVTPFGTYRGGYYPVVYDTKIDARMDDKLDSSISPEEMFSKRFTAFVINNGFTKGRTGNVGKLLFSPDVIADHLGEVIHYATHYDAVKQADKILRAPAFKALVKTHLGDAVYAEMKQWLKDVAANSTGTDRVTDSGSRTLRWLRNSAQLSSLGFNLLSALKQPLGIVNALDAVGPTYWAHGVQKALLSPNVVQNWKDAFAHSKELGPLLKNFDRDLAAISRAYADSVGDRAKTGAYVLAFTPLSVMQSIANVATWHGAYQQAVAQGMSEQDAYDAADKAIRQTQGSGSLKDLTGMQRGGEASKLFTMFYSYFSIVYNRLADIQTRERGAKNLHRKAMRYTILLLIPSLLNMLADDAWEDLFHPDRAEKRDETPFLVRLALETVSSTVAAFPVAREIYSGAEAVVTGKKPRSLPAVGVLEQLTRAGSAIKDITYDGDPLTRAKARSIVQGAGVVSNTPIYGIYRAIDDLFGAKIFDE